MGGQQAMMTVGALESELQWENASPHSLRLRRVLSPSFSYAVELDGYFDP